VDILIHMYGSTMTLVSLQKT